MRRMSIFTRMELAAATKGRRSLNMGKLRKFVLQNREMIAVLVSGLLIAVGWGLNAWDWQMGATVSFVIAFIIGGYAKAKEGVEELIRHQSLNVNMLMIFAAVGSGMIGYWLEGAILIFIFGLSGALETYTMNRSSRELSKLMALQPEEARVYESGVERKVRVDELNVGQTVVVKPGDMVPVDGTIIEGTTTIDQSTITGESIPVEKSAGEQVLSGTVNVAGGVIVRVDKLNEETLFQKMVQLIQKAQAAKPPQQYFIEKFEKHYVIVVLLAVVAVMLTFPLLLNWTWDEAIYRGMVLLVVASPCALVASTMPALLSAISNSARRGALFKDGTHLQTLQRVGVVAFDKTGTLTQGTPEVKDVIGFQGLTDGQLLKVTASIEQLSTHPLAEAIVKKAQNLSLPLTRPQEVVSTSGFGVQAVVNNDSWKVGKREWMDGAVPSEVEQHVRRLTNQGKTVVYVERNKQIVGLLALQDTVRPDTLQAISHLRRNDIHTVMLTGDSEKTARALAKEIGVDEYYANCLPDRKVALVKELRKKYGSVVMVGDGVNDAPALAAASTGVGMGAGTDVALETADIVLVKNELMNMPFLIQLAKRAERVIKLNIAFSVAVIMALIAANFFQSINLPLGVIGHEGSTILVILNGLRLLVVK